jgi:hypothetical protein
LIARDGKVIHSAPVTDSPKILLGLEEADDTGKLAGYKNGTYEDHFPANGKANLKIQPLQRKAKEI